LEYIGEVQDAARIYKATEDFISQGTHVLTPDMGGNGTTESVTTGIISFL
jgi:isocitrate/isopropylmalate dehydrogenase